MISYRDRVYCPFTDCAKLKCNRRLTDAVINAAEVLKMPINQYAEKPDCFQEKL